jgi:serine/threonine protein phosphatase 1
MKLSHSFARWKTLLGLGTTQAQCAVVNIGQGTGRVVQRVARNFKGRDFAVGDIHGCFNDLQQALDEIGFDPDADRLFSVGDLVDRGPQSEAVLDWLARPWFFAVCGNHDYMAWRTAMGKPFAEVDHLRHGGEWVTRLPQARRQQLIQALQALPLAMEVGTPNGWVGLVHAACPGNDWNAMRALNLADLDSLHTDAGQCLWSAQRALTADTSRVRNIRAVVHGHATVGKHLVLGNAHFIDTGGWRPHGYFTLLDLDCLLPAMRVARSSALPASVF